MAVVNHRTIGVKQAKQRQHIFGAPAKETRKCRPAQFARAHASQTGRVVSHRSSYLRTSATMGKKGKKAQTGKPKKLTPKDVGKRMDTLVKTLEEELEDADLFAPLPPTEDCAVCFLSLSRMASNSVYLACCGNLVCVGCVQENEASIKKQNEKKSTGKIAHLCPFCREPPPSSDREYVRQLETRALKNDHRALLNIGSSFSRGINGFPKDELKALDYYIRAVELGSPQACVSIGTCYEQGNGVSVNKEKAALFERVGALRGDIQSRHNIGCSEYHSGNHEIGIRHWKLAAEAGYQGSLSNLRNVYNAGGLLPGKEFVSKEDIDTIYRSGHDAQMEVKSEEREKHSQVHFFASEKESAQFKC